MLNSVLNNIVILGNVISTLKNNSYLTLIMSYFQVTFIQLTDYFVPVVKPRFMVRYIYCVVLSISPGNFEL